MTDMTGKTILHYQIIEQIGQGGMGIVYKARDTKLDRFVALKFLPSQLTIDETEKARFLQEARAAAALNHPNVCIIYEIRDQEDPPFIAMEYVEGETLRQQILNTPSQPINNAIHYAVQIAEALQEAHNKGIVHRDVKSENIMINEKNQVKVMDFGLAKLKGSLRLTKSSSTVGTLAYMAPEHIQGSDADARSDIFWFGVVLYEMLTGRLPFGGDYEAALMYAILNEEPVPLQKYLPNASSELLHILNRSLEKDPADRYQSISDMLIDLRRLKRDTSKVSRRIPTELAPSFPPNQPESVQVKTRKKIWQRPAYLIIAGLLIIVFTLGLQWVLRQGGRAPVIVAPENSIAIMYFENLTGDPSLDWVEAGIVEMLTTNLGRVEGLNVLSSQRLFDVMRQVSPGQPRRIDRSMTTQIAQKAGVRVMLLGNLLGTQGRIRLNSQLVEVSSGKLLGSEVLDAGPGGSLFSLVDSLTQRIAIDLGVKFSIRTIPVNIAYTLTNSPEALREYVEGLEMLYRSKYGHAIDRFEAAIAADSTFAMAYYQLSIARAWQGTGGTRRAREKALQYADKISQRERRLIEADLTQGLAEKKKAFQRLIESYPNEKIAWYRLGEILFHSYWPRAGIKTFLKAIELDPHFLLAYIHPIDFYIFIGQPKKAFPLLQKALALDSLNASFQFDQANFDYFEGRIADATQGYQQVVQLLRKDSMSYQVVWAKAILALLQKDYHKAEVIYINYLDRAPTLRVIHTNSLAGIGAHQGHYKTAKQYLQDALERNPNSVFQIYEAGLFSFLQGRTDATRNHARHILNLYHSGIEPFDEVAILGKHLLILALLSEENLEEARKILSEIESLVMAADNEYAFLYHDALGRLLDHQGDFHGARKHLLQAFTTATFPVWDALFSFREQILDGLLECLEHSGAYQDLLGRIDQTPRPPWIGAGSTGILRARSLLRKARAYEASGQKQSATETYEEFLKLWKEADAGLPELIEGRERLAKLRGA